MLQNPQNLVIRDLFSCAKASVSNTVNLMISFD
jgi:hypothetical protein